MVSGDGGAENSVLFSLTSQKPGGPKATLACSRDADGCIQEPTVFEELPKNDQNHHLGGGGGLYHHDYTGMQDIMTVLSSGLACMRLGFKFTVQD